MNYSPIIIPILGTNYSIKYRNEKDIPADEEISGGDTDFSTKEIRITIPEDRIGNQKNMDYCIKRTIRHEIVHAFFHESGLDANFENPRLGITETIVDWIAIQAPKMLEAFAKAGCLEEEKKNEQGLLEAGKDGSCELLQPAS